MKVLILHPEDGFAPSYAPLHWDLVVDLGRAPTGTYEGWSLQAGCPVVSLYDYADETGDLRHLRKLLQLGTRRVVDRCGIDWWDVFSLQLASGIRRVMLVHRLAKDLPENCDLYASRPDPAAAALQTLLGARLRFLGGGLQSIRRRARRYYDVFSGLGNTELLQVLEDKFDVEHSVRRRFASRRASPGQPVVLLPSAYVNVSRTALSYTALLPNQHFMLVVARRSGYPATVPANVLVKSLTPYFGATDKREIASLRASWHNLRASLATCAPEFKTAETHGLLGPTSAPFDWGIAVRDAWLRFFASEHVTACFSADDSNPNTRIPLVLAKRQGIPALACHHGAFDYRMAIKVNHADHYLVKSEMERDYLSRICKVPPGKTVIVAPPVLSKPPRVLHRSAPWLVFFTEPYAISGWRSDEVYRDLLPRLCSLAQTCGLKLVFKLHPFESIKSHRKMLRRLVPQHERQIEVLAGPPSDQLWNNTRFALTVQSSTAVECCALGIPVFLCAWLRDSWAGYLQQYARFGVGHVLESPDQISEIPELLANQNNKSIQQRLAQKAIEVDDLQDLFSGTYSLPVASNG
jgi:hypothetical protein